MITRGSQASAKPGALTLGCPEVRRRVSSQMFRAARVARPVRPVRAQRGKQVRAGLAGLAGLAGARSTSYSCFHTASSAPPIFCTAALSSTSESARSQLLKTKRTAKQESSATTAAPTHALLKTTCALAVRRAVRAVRAVRAAPTVPRAAPAVPRAAPAVPRAVPRLAPAAPVASVIQAELRHRRMADTH